MYYWMPVIVWMGGIFYLSSQTSVVVSDQHLINVLFFKSLHVIEYGVLMLLVFRALRKTTRVTVSAGFWIALTLTVLYGISDEVHQLFVPTREGHPRDVIIDTFGALASWILVRLIGPKTSTKLTNWVGMS